VESYAYFLSPIYREERPEWVEETLKNTQKHYDQVQPSVVKQTGHMVNDPDLKYLASYFEIRGLAY